MGTAVGGSEGRASPNTRKNIFVAVDRERMIGSEADRRQGWPIGTTSRLLAQTHRIFGDPEAA